MDYSPPGSSVHGLLPGMEWAAMLSSRESSWTRYRTRICWVSCSGTRFFATDLRKPILLALTLNQQKCVMWAPQAKDATTVSIRAENTNSKQAGFHCASPWPDLNGVIQGTGTGTEQQGGGRSGNRALFTPEDQIRLIHPGKEKCRGTSVLRCEKAVTSKRS